MESPATKMYCEEFHAETTFVNPAIHMPSASEAPSGSEPICCHPFTKKVTAKPTIKTTKIKRKRSESSKNFCTFPGFSRNSIFYLDINNFCFFVQVLVLELAFSSFWEFTLASLRTT